MERLAFRFNQVGNWVVHSILQFEFLEERVEVLQQFISIAKVTYCSVLIYCTYILCTIAEHPTYM